MARGVRKTPLEKLNEELVSVQEAIAQYESCLATLKEKKKTLENQVEIEELKCITGLLKEQNMTVDDLKELVNTYISDNDTEQSA